MIFLRRETFKEYIRFYPVTSLILLVLAIMFGLTELRGSSTSPETLIDMGAIYSIQGETHEWWRYFTSVFLHIGLSHLLFNGFAIYVFAAPLERLLGSFQYLVLFILAGFTGSALSMVLTEPPFFAAGASGAIYGIYAAYLYIALFYKHILDEGTRKTISIILVIGFIHSVVVPNVSLYGHLGGFLGGFLYFALLTRHLRRRKP